MPKGQWDNPTVFEGVDYLGRRVTASVFINTTTLAIINPGLTGHRDPGCLYDRVVIGTNTATPEVFLIPEGDFSVTRARINQAGFDVITDITDGGFTFGTLEEPNALA